MQLVRPETRRLNHWITFLAHCLFVLATWTLFIKYLFPIGYAIAHGDSWSRYIYWDAWPLAHVWVGWALLTRPSYTRSLALVVSVVEIIIIISLFVQFLTEPDWTIWRTNWFINKVFVLACFILLLITLITHTGLLKDKPP